MNFFNNRKFNFFHLLLTGGVVAAGTYAFTGSFFTKKEQSQVDASAPGMCKMDVTRLSGLKYIKPLMFVDKECESDELSGLKQRVSEIINRYKATEDVTNASFFLKRYEDGDWTGLNEDDTYQPGSLFKVPVLITILKMNELHPGFLNKTIVYNQKYQVNLNVAYTDKKIELGHSYTVRELLDYMIKYSDNDATILLEKNMDATIFSKLFEDMGFKAPGFNDPQYLLSVREYSFFMRAIYNAAYISIDDSEYAAELLTHCQFKDGILKGLPPGTVVAHKFGESGDPNSKQLHESGIVYLKGNPYMLTIMTKGKDNQKLSQLIAEISQAVYLEMHNEEVSTM